MKELYSALPVWAQHLAVSAVGLRRQWQRYGGRFQRHLALARERQWWPEDRLAEYQLERLRALVSFAMQHVPYFRDTYSRAGIQPDALQSIKQLPMLEKDVYRTQLDRCVAEIWPRSRLLEFHTSGSTGTPLTCFSELDDFRERMAFLVRQWEWAGAALGDRVATFTGNLIVSRSQQHPPFWRYNLPGRQLMLSSYHMSEENLPRYADALRRFRPAVIEGYPSAIFNLAHYLNRHRNMSPIKPRGILTTAEGLQGFQRDEIQRAFSAHVHNYYGSSDGAPLITECEAGGLHLNLDMGIFEFLRPDGSDASPGEEAEMVVTNFSSRAMPLLRYRIRDAAVLEPRGRCDCGRYMPRVRTIIGRLDDMIYAPGRGWISRLGQVLYGCGGSVREAQIVQDSVDEIVVRLVTDPARFTETQLPPLLADLRSRLGELVRLRVDYVNEISRGRNNKFKYVVCNLSSEEKDRLRGAPIDNRG